MSLLSVAAVITRTNCCNKDCKVTVYSPINYGCDTCHGQCHWECLGPNDAHKCISCSKQISELGKDNKDDGDHKNDEDCKDDKGDFLPLIVS